MNRSQWIAFYNDSYFPLKKRGYTNNVFLSCVNKAKERNHIFLFFYSFFFPSSFPLCSYGYYQKKKYFTRNRERTNFRYRKRKIKIWSTAINSIKQGTHKFYCYQQSIYIIHQKVAFIQENKHAIIATLLTLLSWWTRFRKISINNMVVWDEAHFGQVIEW